MSERGGGGMKEGGEGKERKKGLVVREGGKEMGIFHMRREGKEGGKGMGIFHMHRREGK